MIYFSFQLASAAGGLEASGDLLLPPAVEPAKRFRRAHLEKDKGLAEAVLVIEA